MTTTIDTLKLLASKKDKEDTMVQPTQVIDPVMVNAKCSKNTVTLGFDPNFSEIAKKAAELKQKIDNAEADFSSVQSQVRDYGKKKRAEFNQLYKADVSTICIPYSVETPDGQEHKNVHVTFQNRYSVNKEVVMNNKSNFGAHFDRLFLVEETKTLKPDAEHLIRGLLIENGIQGESLDSAMAVLFQTELKVKTNEHFEKESREVPESIKKILDISVTQAQPSLKFPK